MNLPSNSKILNMKTLIILFFPLLLSACFTGEEVFDCGGKGLVISGKKATLGAYNYELCEKKGVELYFAEKCNTGTFVDGFYFDTITNRLQAGDIFSGQCKKVK